MHAQHNTRMHARAAADEHELSRTRLASTRGIGPMPYRAGKLEDERAACNDDQAAQQHKVQPVEVKVLRWWWATQSERC
jgi:hypothetical protein